MSPTDRSTRWRTTMCALVLLVTPLAAQAQNAQSTGTISGTVTDSAGTPVAGARVTVEGTALAIGSGQTGRFTLAGVPTGTRVVSARVLGYRPQNQTVTVTAGATATVNFRLGRAPVELATIVSTGYATQTKATMTGAAEVVGGEEIQKRPVANISKGLQGFMPGVVVRDFGGRPGSDGAQIRIRGAGTLGDNGALILVDGVVGEINNLDPLDIESVSVLKDAASAAIYGARAGNGVVIIKTRRGRNTGSLKVTYDGYAATQAAQDMPQRVDIRTELNAVNQVYVNSGQAPKYTAGYIDSTANGLDPIKYPNTNWLNLIYKSAPMQDHTVRVTGGNDLAQLSLSANHFDQEGILTTENFYRRTTLRGNSDFNVTKKLTAAADLMLMDEHVVRPRGEGDAQFRALHDTPPTSLAFYPDGSYSWSKSAFNPVALLREQGNVNSRWRTASLNTRAVYDWKNGLKVSGYFTGDNKDNRDLDFRPAYRFVDEATPTVARMENVRNVSRDTRNNDYNIEVQATGEYERMFGSHQTHLLVGYDQRQSDHDDVFAERQGAYNNDLQLPGQGDASFQNTGSNARTSRLVGIFGRFNYNWNNRYLFEANLRRDGSSRFGPNKKYGTFPSFSAAWRLSEEPMLRGRLGFIDDLKLRGSWGRLGNDRIGDYLFQQTINLNSGNYTFNNALASGATPGRIANPDIGWETTEQTNGGVDMELLRNRLSITGDVYRKITTGILLQIPISSLVGATAPTQNAGAVSNVGWETGINWRDHISALNYQIGVNLSDNKNRITELPGGDQIGSGTIRRVGEPIDAIFGIRAVGIFRDSAELKSWATQVPGKTGPGDLKYQDQNGDGKIDGNDRIVIGDPFPHYIWGANLSAQFKRLDVSLLFQGVGKQDAYMDGALIEGPTWENFFPEYLRDSWTPQNLDAKFPRFVFRSDHNHNAPGRNSWWVRDARYAALKNVNVGYTLPNGLVHRAGLGSARFYVAGTNVYTWSKMKGLLPAELNPSSSRGTYYYQTRNWSIGTSLSM
ncbi:TonB-dependent outer membrane protein, SusC/RagA (plasmid) [Gemmatirosa kalamazoonensis]|uniref:TonB-dependent outer membrane protein, SusC/RagA n=1 Tax=Gemmatirosa kalamazoonensis TaxID=861299 RepID=W0RS76_9BACT|nr:TonB-dependent receptor [Gemmatirosa kalamazoonensis]AHG93829.1 TonB-dependent outer membrane protein, SusC/RagA [Gemmatirosa kalamazoonensis]